MTARTARSTSASATATKKPATAIEAPIWKNYLAVRTEISVNDSASWRLQLHGGALTQARSRKRSKPSNIYTGSGSNANWTAIPSQAQNRYVDERSFVAPRIRKYWEQLSANERQQILFIDDPDLVKQLYKLNLSLLCVGLMQRHLKTPLKQTTVAKSVTTSQSTATTVAAAATPSSVQPETNEAAATLKSHTALETKPPPALAALADTQTEKTYELLEAMEFMDLGTGILTVKSELVEDPDRLFTLVGDVLFGFVTSIHVLGEKQFYDLFVTESEVINSWEDYQRLIAMLVEQLIIKSYVNHLEKEATIQMEELLLEVSLEDSKPTRKDHTTSKDANHIASSSQKSKKKKKKKKDTVSSARRDDSNAKDQPEPEEFDDNEHEQAVNDENDPDASKSTTASSNTNIGGEMAADDDIASDEAEDGTSAIASLVDDTSCTTEAFDLATESKEQRASSSLNPNASVFQPQQEVQLPDVLSDPPSVVGKRKLDKYIVNVQFQDAISDDEYYRDGDHGLDYSSDDDFADDLISPQRQQRRREEDAELAWQLQQMYASTSTMLGWDFTRQCEVVVHPGLVLPWDESVLWRTAPKEVVRYFTPGAETGNGFGPFFPPGVPYPFAPPRDGGVGGPSSQPNSRYYFAPPFAASAMPLSTAFLPSGGGGSPHPRMLPPPSQGGEAGVALPHPQQQRMFAFQEANFLGVVTSPDFPSTKPELHDRLRHKKAHQDPG